MPDEITSFVFDTNTHGRCGLPSRRGTRKPPSAHAHEYFCLFLMYGRLFECAFTGSMRGAGFHVYAVWSYALAHARRDSTVELNPDDVAARLGGSVQEVQSAIDFLCAPDTRSRTPTEEGRRMIREGQFLFRIVNKPKYDAIRSEVDRKEYQRNWDRTRRKRPNSEPNPTQSDSVRHNPTNPTPVAVAVAVAVDAVLPAPPPQVPEREAAKPPRAQSFKAPTRGEVDILFANSGAPATEADKFWGHYMANGWKVGRTRMVSLPHAVGNWVKNWRAGTFEFSGNGNGNGHAKSEVSDRIKRLATRTDNELTLKVATNEISHEDYESATNYRNSHPNPPKQH